jgi:hypothetical protein
MEARIVSDLNPAFSEIYLSAFRDAGLRVYAKYLNLEGWYRSTDIFLLYDDEQELQAAREIVHELESSIDA